CCQDQPFFFSLSFPSLGLGFSLGFSSSLVIFSQGPYLSLSLAPVLCSPIHLPPPRLSGRPLRWPMDPFFFWLPLLYPLVSLPPFPLVPSWLRSCQVQGPSEAYSSDGQGLQLLSPSFQLCFVPAAQLACLNPAPYVSPHACPPPPDFYQLCRSQASVMPQLLVDLLDYVVPLFLSRH
ncbi:unnamed protein product, partial [Closterium sp. NIES-54]